jgi:hypothetical protein
VLYEKFIYNKLTERNLRHTNVSQRTQFEYQTDNFFCFFVINRMVHNSKKVKAHAKDQGLSMHIGRVFVFGGAGSCLPAYSVCTKDQHL